MTERKDGGAAFPLDINNEVRGYVQEGMSLRDWFAGQIVGALIAKPTSFATNIDEVRLLRESFVITAYELADEMIAHRSKLEATP